MPLALIITLALGLALAASTATILLALRHRHHNITTANTRLRHGMAPGPSPIARQCPVCTHVCESFAAHGARPDARCPNCGSLERHRLAWLYLLNETDLLSGMQPRRMLHLAPRAPLWRKFAAVPAIEYLSADPDPGRAVVQLDPAHFQYDDNSFDVVYCGELLDRVAAEERQMSELLRVLRPGGWALLQVPSRRRFGEHYPDRLAAAGFQVTADAYVRRLPSPAADHYGLEPDAEIYLARKPPIGCAGRLRRVWCDAHELLDSVAIPGAQPLVLGRVEQVQDGVVSGWAWSPAAPGWRVTVRVSLDGERVGAAVADLPRPSLSATGIGDGAHGFRIALPPELASPGRHDLRVAAENGVALAPAAGFETVIDRGRRAQARCSIVGSVLGRVDGVRDGVLHGWALRPAAPDLRVAVRAMLDGLDAGEIIADRPSAGAGRCRFALALPAPPADGGPHSLWVRADGIVPLPAAASFEVTGGDRRSAGVTFSVNGDLLH